MRVKRYVGDNIADTMATIKRDLGSDAVILQTRQFREGGFFGWFAKSKVEITAAVEDPPSVTQKPVGAAEIVSAPAFKQSKPEDSALEQELSTMRQMLENLNKQMKDFGGETSAWPPPLQPWAEYLRQRGIGEHLVRRLLRLVRQALREEDWSTKDKVYACLKDNITKMCMNSMAIQPGDQKPRVIALIGPTGVGKTTTIGKLAAGFSMVDKRRVALITADTYRVAAVEQLKTFGEIIGVPVEVVMTPTGLKESLAQHADKELIFIDTAGRSPQHDLHMSELRALLDKAQPDLSILVLSATMSAADQLHVFQRFKHLTTHFLFTKLDETSCSGTILNLIDQSGFPISYVTTGQSVPDDIEAATPERITRYILGP